MLSNVLNNLCQFLICTVLPSNLAFLKYGDAHCGIYKLGVLSTYHSLNTPVFVHSHKSCHLAL